MGQYESFNDQGVKTDNLSSESLSLLDNQSTESTVREAEAPIATQSNCETIDNQTQYTVGHHVPTQVQAEATLSEPLTIDNATNACWYLHAQVENLKVPLLFDTGSPISIISQEIYNKMSPERPCLAPTKTNFVAANGTTLEILGQGTFKFATEVKTYNWVFLVANIQGNAGIIGQDFIDSYGRQLKWKNLSWYTKDGVIRLFKRNSNQVAKILINKTTHVPPESELFVKASTDYPLYEAMNLVEPLSSNQKRGLLIARSLINNEGESKVSVLNLTDKPIKLKAGEVVGHVCSVEESSCTPKDPGDCGTLPDHLKPLVDNLSDELTAEQKQQFSQLIHEFQDIFVGPDGKLGQTDLAYHKIETGDAKPIKIPPRKCPIAQREIIETELDKMLQQKVIEPSDSPWSAPICLVRKSDGTYRFAIDFRGLNAVTEKDAYPLPNIRQIFDTLSGSRWYNTIDMAAGYWQIPMEPSHKKKTAFTTPTRGLFHFLVLPFGLCNSGATFERVMERVLGNLQWVKCICYLDDVIIFGSTFDTTLSNLRAVFSRLKAANLKLKPSKCKFFQRSVAFLGHIATEYGTRCDPAKTEAIQDWPRPQNRTEMKSFLGLVNFYRSYIPNCAEIAHPLNNLTRKSVKFKWDEKCEDAFNELKRSLITPPLLVFPTRNGKFILQTDASGYGIGAILSQEQDGKEVVISYGSKTLTKTQQNYCTTMRELYAVIFFVRYYSHYLMGRPFEIRTDHASLVWIKNFKDADGMLSRWLTVLDTYDFTISHRKGSAMKHVDALSRIRPRKCKRETCVDCIERGSDWPHSPCYDGQELSPYQQQPDSQSTDGYASVVSSLRTYRAEGQPHPSTIAPDDRPIDIDPLPNWISAKSHEELRNLQLEDPSFTPVLRSKEKNERPPKETLINCAQNVKTLYNQWDLLEIKHGVLYKRYMREEHSYLTLVAPESMRRDIFTELHQNRTAGHFGRDRTVEAIKRRFYWPNIGETVQRWCTACDLCARCKPGPGLGRFPLKQIEVTRRFQVIALDIFGPLPISDNGMEYIVVIGDYFTKFIEAFALANHAALTVADKLVTEIICRYGCPEQIHSDMGREFESNLFHEVCRLLGVNKTRTCPYRPQSDSIIERFNRTLKQMLTTFCANNTKDWDDHLPYLMMASRASVHASTKCTPNLLMFGQEINCPIDLMYGPPPDRVSVECPIAYAEWLQSAMQSAFQTAHNNIKQAAKRQKYYYDRTAEEKQFEIGRFVWQHYPPEANKKLHLAWTGPYLTVGKISDWTYTIQRDPTSRRFNVHVDHLKAYLGENNPRPWVGLDGIPVNVSEEEGPTDSYQWEEQNPDLYVTYEEESTLNEPEPLPEPVGSPNPSPVRTRVGRIVKPRQIYSP